MTNSTASPPVRIPVRPGVARPKIDTATFTRERVLVDLFHHAVERSERAVRHAHLLADFKRDRRLRPLDAFLHLMQDAVGFGIRNRHRLLVGAEKAGDLRRVLDEVIDLIGQIHLHQHIAGKELALGLDLAAASRLGDFFLRHQHFVDMLCEAALLGLLAD